LRGRGRRRGGKAQFYVWLHVRTFQECRKKREEKKKQRREPELVHRSSAFGHREKEGGSLAREDAKLAAELKRGGKKKRKAVVDRGRATREFLKEGRGGRMPCALRQRLSSREGKKL